MNLDFRKIINPFYIILVGVFLRLVPHEPNFAPITAMALFGGVYLPKKWAIVLPLGAMLISDYLLLYINPFQGQVFNFNQIYSPLAALHPDILFVYLSFAFSGLIGVWLKNHKKVTWLVGASVIASWQFFLITNFGVWLTGFYPKTAEGLLLAYLAGIPFFRPTILGDLFYTGIFFGSFELALKLSRHLGVQPLNG